MFDWLALATPASDTAKFCQSFPQILLVDFIFPKMTLIQDLL